MTQDNLTQEENINNDKLETYYSEKIKVHLILKRTDNEKKNIFLNGFLLRKASDRVWILNERVLGEIRVAISEIKEDGVQKYFKEGEVIENGR
jgi:hypothetical protein